MYIICNYILYNVFIIYAFLRNSGEVNSTHYAHILQPHSLPHSVISGRFLFSFFASLPLLGSQNLMIIETGSHNFVQVEVYQKTWIFLILDWKKKQSSRSERPT